MLVSSGLWTLTQTCTIRLTRAPTSLSKSHISIPHRLSHIFNNCIMHTPTHIHLRLTITHTHTHTHTHTTHTYTYSGIIDSGTDSMCSNNSDVCMCPECVVLTTVHAERYDSGCTLLCEEILYNSGGREMINFAPVAPMCNAQDM